MIKKSNKGFSMIELLISTAIILLVGIGLAKGVLDLTRYNLRVQLNQLANQTVQSWTTYIKSIPYNSWIINPDPNDTPGGSDLYCFDCAFNKGFCSLKKKVWPGGSEEHFCSFFDPNYSPFGSGKPFDQDNDGIIALYDPYYLNNNCKDGSSSCSSENKKYRFPSWYLAGWLRFQPDWGQGSSDCACRLGNCAEGVVGSSWTSYDGSRNFRISETALGGLKCTYELKRGVSSAGISWNPSYLKVYVGMTIINYYFEENPAREIGKAIGIVAWYFDPITYDYKAVYSTVFKERP